MKYGGNTSLKNPILFAIAAGMLYLFGMCRFDRYLEDQRRLIEARLDELMPAEDVPPRELHAAMRYSALGGGKRIRAILCVCACVAGGGMAAEALTAAAALEILHAYTLIHDDLPAMDDDDMRRGKPSCHKAFGEAEAILAGDALLTLAFELLARNGSGALLGELAAAAGSRGVVGGQYLDIKSGSRTDDEETLRFIQTHKTADLIRVACRMGGIVAGVDESQLESLDIYGGNVGIAFQIVDDLLDETGSQELLGKPVGSDRGQSKMTAVTLYGIEGARSKAQELIAAAKRSLQTLPGDARPLEMLADMMLARDS